MKIGKLNLTNFRNIESASLKPNGASIVVLYGENGAGKTNCLEALSLLTPGRGLHKHPASSHAGTAGTGWTIFSELSTREEQHTVGYSYEKEGSKVLINEEEVKAKSTLSVLGNVVWFTPKMDRLFMDSAQGRRDFLDRLVYGLYPHHSETLHLYKHHLKSRLNLLKRGAAADWISLEEEQAAKHGLELLKVRRTFLKKLAPHLGGVTLTLSESEREMPEDLFFLLEGFANSRARDARFGASHFGPHRMDVVGTHNSTPLPQTSTGQHKRAVLEILLANARLLNAEKGAQPLLLLDEVTAHLDKNVRKAFFEELTKLGTQIWLTGTEKQLFADLKKAAFFKVEGGSFR